MSFLAEISNIPLARVRALIMKLNGLINPGYLIIANQCLIEIAKYYINHYGSSINDNSYSSFLKYPLLPYYWLIYSYDVSAVKGNTTQRIGNGKVNYIRIQLCYITSSISVRYKGTIVFP